MKTIRIFTVLCAALLLGLTTSTWATDVSGDQTGAWTLANSPYNVTGEINVPASQTLTIEPGVQVIFQGHYKFIVNSNATLLAVGTAADSIRFTAADPTTGWWGIRFLSASNNSRLEFCNLKYGKATGAGYDGWGGAIYSSYSGLTISHSTVQLNSATYSGGGFFCNGGSQSITDNTISGNSATYGFGGGIFLSGGANATISGNTFSGNSTTAGGYTGGGAIMFHGGFLSTISDNTFSGNSGAYGGAFFLYSAHPTISGNTFSGNSATSYGGGIHCDSGSQPTISGNSINGNSAGLAGGGISCYYDGYPWIIGNSITNNSSYYGGGIYCNQFSRCWIIGNTIRGNSATEGGGVFFGLGSAPHAFQLNEITENSASGSGGGVKVDLNENFTMNKNTIACNTASNGGGLYSTGIFNRTIINCIHWGNSPQQMILPLPPFQGSVSVTYSDIQGSWLGTGNINADPLFVNTPQSDYHLQAGSPCIDTGDLNPAYNDPDGSGADMGCYYFPRQLGAISGTISPAIPNLTINLSQDGVIVASALTLSNGTYHSPVLTPGTYYVDLVVPVGYFVNQNHLTSVVLPEQISMVDFSMSSFPVNIEGQVGPPWAGFTVTVTSSQLYTFILTNASGEYHFENLAGNSLYTVELVSPLGFLMASENPVTRYVTGGTTETVNFTMTPIVTSNNARSMGYWKHQVNANIWGNGNSDYITTNLEEFGLDIFDHFYGSYLNPINVEAVTYIGDPAAALNIYDLQTMLNINQGGSTMYQRACQQYLTLLLNVTSNKLGQYAAASYDNPPRTVSQAIVHIATLLNSAVPNAASNAAAKNIAETLDLAQKVAAGVIPVSTPNVIFGEGGEVLSLLPKEFSFGVSPNPFNPTTAIHFDLPEAVKVNLAVYDVSGRQVAQLVNGLTAAGTHQATFDGSSLASGVYLYRLTAGVNSATGKMVLMK